MDIKDILNKVDHTNLSVTATYDDIKSLCDEAIHYNCASVCIAPSFVSFASEYVKGAIPVCTVIGFPNGYSTKEAKCFEAENAVKNGADEIDMVININLLKSGFYDDISEEIRAVKNVCKDKILKVIIEACLLTEDEKIRMCKIISESGADFIKTSTGFSTGGATKHDIELFNKYVTNGVNIKAAGGISSLEDAEDFINLGADRLGTSRIIKLLKNIKSGDAY